MDALSIGVFSRTRRLIMEPGRSLLPEYFRIHVIEFSRIDKMDIEGQKGSRPF
jgi:hypothetical protein